MVRVEYASHFGTKLETREGSAGIDIVTPDHIFIRPGKTVFLDTGLRLAIDENSPQVFYMVVPRSSMGKRGMFLTNTVGIIDHLYRGDNDNLYLHLGCRDDVGGFAAEAGERIAQIIFLQSVPVEFIEVERLDNPDRGGFGSTGR